MLRALLAAPPVQPSPRGGEAMVGDASPDPHFSARPLTRTRPSGIGVKPSSLGVIA
jgi:hypothetical protein